MKNYQYLSHTHCFDAQTPACGLKGRHCCLCDIVSKEKVLLGYEGNEYGYCLNCGIKEQYHDVMCFSKEKYPAPIVSKGEEKKCEHYLHGNAEFFCRGCEHICPGGGVIEKGDDKFCSYFECDFDLRRSLNIPLKAEVSEWDWQSEFRDYFDKTLKPKKPSMKNLDRELIIDFIIKVRNQTLEDYKNRSPNSGRLMFQEGYNAALKETEKF